MNGQEIGGYPCRCSWGKESNDSQRQASSYQQSGYSYNPQAYTPWNNGYEYGQQQQQQQWAQQQWTGQQQWAGQQQQGQQQTQQWAAAGQWGSGDANWQQAGYAGYQQGYDYG